MRYYSRLNIITNRQAYDYNTGFITKCQCDFQTDKNVRMWNKKKINSTKVQGYVTLIKVEKVKNLMSIKLYIETVQQNLMTKYEG